MNSVTLLQFCILVIM